MHSPPPSLTLPLKGGGDSQPSLPPDYILVGHLTRDILESGTRAGGTVLYAGVAAARLGRRVAVATVCGDDVAFPPECREVIVSRRRSSHTTTFAITAGPAGRSLRLLARAPRLRARDLPLAWKANHPSTPGAPAPILHLAPVADEVPPDAWAWFEHAQAVATAQGWLRSYRADGLVSPTADALAALPVEGLSALVVSAEDVGGAATALAASGLPVPVVAVTRGADGCTVHARGRTVEVPGCPAHEVDATGAGDVFAAAFFVRLAETGDPVASAYFAACAAALSVEGVGLSRIPVRQEVEERLAAWLKTRGSRLENATTEPGTVNVAL